MGGARRLPQQAHRRPVRCARVPAVRGVPARPCAPTLAHARGACTARTRHGNQRTLTVPRYAAYNKPEAVIDWLDHNVPKHDYVLVLDSDMILRRPFFVETMGPRKGLAVGARYTYMIGVANELAVRHIPHG